MSRSPGNSTLKRLSTLWIKDPSANVAQAEMLRWLEGQGHSLSKAKSSPLGKHSAAGLWRPACAEVDGITLVTVSTGCSQPCDLGVPEHSPVCSAVLARTLWSSSICDWYPTGRISGPAPIPCPKTHWDSIFLMSPRKLSFAAWA